MAPVATRRPARARSTWGDGGERGRRRSHAIIHTRVYGQAAAIASVLTIFGLKDLLGKMGAPWPLDEDAS